MEFGSALKGAQTVIKHNSPAILTGVAVVGTVTTAFLATQAGFKAANVIREYEQHRDSLLDGPYKADWKEKIQIAWPLFIPTIGVGALTVSCVLGANHVHGRKAAALAGAYSLSEKAFAEYRDKVVEQIGTTKETKVRDAVAQDQTSKDEHKISEIVIQDSMDWACYETMSGRYFTTTVEKLKQAQNELNKKLLDDGYASLNEYWDLVGLESTTVGDELGWTSDRLLEIHITTTLGKDGRPCLSLGYVNPPITNYWKSFR